MAPLFAHLFVSGDLSNHGAGRGAARRRAVHTNEGDLRQDGHECRRCTVEGRVHRRMPRGQRSLSHAGLSIRRIKPRSHQQCVAATASNLLKATIRFRFGLFSSSLKFAQRNHQGRNSCTNRCPKSSNTTWDC